MKRASLIFFMALLLAGCGQSRTLTESDKQFETYQPQVTITFTNSPLPTNTFTPTRIPIKHEDLVEALISLDDLPSGWLLIEESTTSPAEEGSGTFKFLCEEFPKRGIDEVSNNYRKATLGPWLTFTIVQYPEDQATITFLEMREAVDRCNIFTSTDESGTSTEYTASLISFTKYGDDIFAIRLSSTVSLLGLMEADSVYILKGNLIVRVSYMVLGMEGIDSSFTEQYVTYQMENVDKLFI
jgi:hypothetical protein